MHYLNQIFYKCNKFDNANQLKQIQHLMLTKNFFQQINSMALHDGIHNVDSRNTSIVEKEVATNSKDEAPTKQNSLFIPDSSDSLFWCMYISVYGYNDFLLMHKKLSNRELEEKHKMIDFIKSNTAAMKESNIKVSNTTIQEYLSELMLNQKSNLKLLLPMAVYYKKNIIAYNDNTYHLILFHKESVPDVDNTTLLYHKGDGVYGIETEVTQEKITHIMTQKIKMEAFDKAFRASSGYKVGELNDIAEKLGLFADEKVKLLKKQDLYDKIVSSCKW